MPNWRVFYRVPYRMAVFYRMQHGKWTKLARWQGRDVALRDQGHTCGFAV